MDISGTIQLIATLAEVVVALLAILIATKKKKTYGWFVGITFGLFVVFDIARIFALDVSAELHALVLLIACISMVYAAWLMWNEQ
jgi:ABC-type lipoprotein release transport system permease subunit